MTLVILEQGDYEYIAFHWEFPTGHRMTHDFIWCS